MRTENAAGRSFVLILVSTLLPPLGLFYPQGDEQRNKDRRKAAEKHRSPSKSSADRIIQRSGDEKSEVVASLQISGAHFAAVFGPGFGDVGASERPFPADSDAR